MGPKPEADVLSTNGTASFPLSREYTEDNGNEIYTTVGGTTYMAPKSFMLQSSLLKAAAAAIDGFADNVTETQPV